MRIGVALVATALLVTALDGGLAQAQSDWTIDSFDVQYDIQRTGEVLVTEDIRVDFGFLQRHGIFRDMPVRYRYDDDHDRLIAVGDVTVDDGSSPHQFELISSGPNLRIKIGDPDRFVTGEQRYRISYTLLNALNPTPLDESDVPRDWDEFFWNVTGNDWEATIENASATVRLPTAAIEQITCYQGPTGSRDPCAFSESGSTASFAATIPLRPGSGLTLVTAIERGAVDVGPPVLVDPEKSDWQRFKDLWVFSPLAIGSTAIVGVAALIALVRLWWIEGRDRWHGDMHHLYEGNEPDPATRKPLLARETIVVEYEPPAVQRRGRQLRPAEVGLLVDETADTLDVTASIVDLAVRGHLKITEEKSGGVFGLFKKTDYVLDQLPGNEADLLPYEAKLKASLFKGGKSSVKLSELKNKFHEDLDRVKKALYTQAVRDKFFPRSPDSTRTMYQIIGIAAVGVGIALGIGLGFAFGGALIGVPVVIGGLLLFLLAPLFPRRTALGRILMRRSLGFRKFMVTAETERQRFAERTNIFHEYLPYAIVFGCVDKWAKAFEDLGMMPDQPSWYSGTRPFSAGYFAGTMASFSSSVSGTIASTPGGSGGSGFGGGGGSGGGGGGGGGGSW